VAGNLGVAFFALAVTGAGALCADMGDFGPRAIARAWLGLVLPACMASYFGEGALLLGDQGAGCGGLAGKPDTRPRPGAT
jgi:KUP system potassium uptake protein